MIFHLSWLAYSAQIVTYTQRAEFILARSPDGKQLERLHSARHHRLSQQSESKPAYKTHSDELETSFLFHCIMQRNHLARSAFLLINLKGLPAPFFALD